MIKLKQLLTEKTVRISTMKDANFEPGQFVQLMGKKGMVKLDKKSVHKLAKIVRTQFGKGKGMGWSFTSEGKLTERINVEKFVKAIEKGKDVVVYDKKGKRYNLQGGDKKSVQVTDHWEDAGRRNVHPEKTWQTLPLSKVKKIVIEGKLTEGKFKMKGKYLYMPGGEVSSLPGAYDNDALKVTIGRESFNIYKGRKGIIAIGDSYSKEFKNGNDLAKWLNKEKAKYIGIDRR